MQEKEKRCENVRRPANCSGTTAIPHRGDRRSRHRGTLAAGSNLKMCRQEMFEHKSNHFYPTHTFPTSTPCMRSMHIHNWINNCSIHAENMLNKFKCRNIEMLNVILIILLESGSKLKMCRQEMFEHKSIISPDEYIHFQNQHLRGSTCRKYVKDVQFAGTSSFVLRLERHYCATQ